MEEDAGSSGANLQSPKESWESAEVQVETGRRARANCRPSPAPPPTRKAFKQHPPVGRKTASRKAEVERPAAPPISGP